MCGRFALEAPWAVVVKLLKAETLDEADWSPAFNICPTDPAPIVHIGPLGARQAAVYRWGLVPFWAKEPKIGARFINARAETAATTRAFKAAFASARCVVPASGFYEWTTEPDGKGKQPHWIHPTAGGVVTFAGLYAKWRAKDGTPLRTFTILTTAASEDVAGLHDRMPVILPTEARERWLDPAAAPGALQELLKPAAPGSLAHHPVAKTVNDVRADGPELVKPLAPGPANLELVF